MYCTWLFKIFFVKHCSTKKVLIKKLPSASLMQTFLESPEDYSLFSRHLEKGEDDASQNCPRVNYEHIPILPKGKPESVKSRLHQKSVLT